MPRYIDVDVLWKNVTGNIDDCADFLEIIKRQPIITIDHIAEDSKKASFSWPHENGRDVIYRQDAIDIINADKTPPNTPLITPTAKRDFEIYDSACDRHIKMIGELPSAQPDLLDDGTLMMTVPHGILSDVKRVLIDEVGTKDCKVMYQDEPERGCDECVFKSFKQFQPEPQWIPCSERLPELYVRVLVTDGEDVEMSKLSRMSGEGYIWLFETCWNDCKDWPYWMPLPEPWKGDTE